MLKLNAQCVILILTTLLHLYDSQDFSAASDKLTDWWAGKCGAAVNHVRGRAPGQSYRSPLGSSPWQVSIFALPRVAKRQTKLIDFSPRESSAANPPELWKSRASSIAGSMTFLCVGTIISPSIIITAASCLFNENTKKAIRPERLRVIAAKQLLSLKHEIDAQSREVQLVRVLDTYEGEITSQAENLAILATQTEFFINNYVQPVCVDVSKIFSEADWKRGLRNNTIEGAAFGLSKQVPSSGELREAVFRFQNYTECRRRVPEDSTIQYYLQYDKFCIDTPQGRLPEDTGMGLVTLVDDRYYLQGVLSANVVQEFSVVTNISEHTTWLNKIVKRAVDNIQCRNMFICSNKACIEPSRKCDGFDDCGDGSDESACGNRLPGGVQKSSCELPPLLSGGLFSLDDRTCVESCTLGSGDEIAAGQSVQLTCGQGTAVPDNNPLGNYACLSNGRWSPEPPKCIFECSPLEKPNVNITCEYNYYDVSCRKYMRPGTIATYRCDSFYTLLNPLAPKETKCLEGGRWRNEPPECVPECGVLNPLASSTKPTIAFGADVKNVLEHPWQVALHHKNSTHPKWVQHCGGSIIRPHLILTAAHCLYFSTEVKRFKIEDLLVTAGKYKRDFYDIEDNQQDSTVKELIIPAAYNGYHTVYAQDIAIVELSRPFKMSSYVLPVCLKFGEKLDLTNTIGTLVGWGYTEKKFGVSSDILLKSELPLITLEECKKIKKPTRLDNFHRFLTYDKICGRFQNGSGPQKGDSGGGIIVNKGPKWFVIGIASIIDSKNTMAGITDINIHQNFITETIRTHKGHSSQGI